MNFVIDRHKKLMDNIRRQFGDANFVSILNCLNTQVQIEPDEDNKYLLDIETERYKLLVERDEERKEISTQSIINNTTDTNNFKIDNKEEKRTILSCIRDNMQFDIKNIKKHRILHCAILYCIENKKSINTLNNNVYNDIAIVCDTTPDSVKTTILRIVDDKKYGLTVKEKQYYIMFLANKDITNVTIYFPFLKYDTTQNPERKIR